MVALLLVLLIAGCARPPVAPALVDRAESLVVAARGNSIPAMQHLLAAGVSPDTMAPDGTRPLTEAARHGRVATEQTLLNAGARIDLTDSSGLRPFDYAMEAGHREAAALLARQAAQDAGASPQAIAWFDALAGQPAEARNWHRVLDGEVASLGLMAAVLAKRDDVVATLRGAGGIPNHTGYAALAVAARFGDAVAVTELLGANGSPDVEVSGDRRETPLMEAAEDGYVAVGRKLIRAGARVNHFDNRGETALMWAVRQGETDYARMLLDAGADLALRNRAGETALDIARRINHTDLITLLEARSGHRRLAR